MSIGLLSANARAVLGVIWRDGPVARHVIADRVNLTPTSVTRLTRELEDLGLVAEQPAKAVGRGQPVKPLALHPDGAFAFGVYFSHSYMDTGIVDLAGRPVSFERSELASARSDLIADAARQALARQVERLGLSMDRVIGAGFALPGDFGETPAFLKAHAYFPDLMDRDVSAELASRMPLPTFVENDAASAALGERVHGIGRRYDSFVFIHVGHGVGSGLIVDGRLVRGVHGNAGVIGIIYPMSEPRPSGQDLLETLNAQGVPARDFNSLETIHPEECPPLRRWITRAAVQLGQAVHISGRLLDPAAVILGGRLPDHILAALHQAVRAEKLFSPILPSPEILKSNLGDKAGVIGAAAVCMFNTLWSNGE